MALKKSILEISLYGGLDQATDDFASGTGKLLELSNADLTTAGTVKKRTGYDLLERKTVVSDSLVVRAPHTIGTHQNQLLVISNDGYIDVKDTFVKTSVHESKKIFTYLENTEEWHNVGDLTPMDITTATVSQSSEYITSPTCAFGNGYKVFAYNLETSFWDGKTLATIKNANNGNIIQRGVQVSTVDPGYTFYYPRLHYLENEDGTEKRFSCLSAEIHDGNHLLFSRWNWNCDPATSFSTTNTEQGYINHSSISVDCTGNAIWDACAPLEKSATNEDGYYPYQIWAKEKANLSLYVYTSAHTPVWYQQWNKNYSNLLGVTAYGIRPAVSDDDFVRLFHLWQDPDDQSLHGLITNICGKELVADTQITTDTQGYRVGNITLARDPQFDIHVGDTSAYTLAVELYQDGYTDGYNGLTYFKVIDDSLQSITDETNNNDRYVETRIGVGLAAHAFTHEQKAYFPLLYDSAYGASYYISSLGTFNSGSASGGTNYGTTKLVTHARIFGNTAGPSRYKVTSNVKYSRGLSETVKVSTDNYMFAGLKQERLLSEGDIQYSVQEININLNPDPLPMVEMGPTTIIGGGMLQLFDGTINQLGFPVAPENSNQIGISYGAGSVPTGTFKYKVVYEWYDDAGQIYRSNPSPAITVEVAGSNDAIVQLTIPNPAISNLDRQADDNGVQVHIYRTEASGTIYYKLPVGNSYWGSATNYPWAWGGTSDDPTTGSGYYYFVDTSADADITDNQQLYTTGGVLDNVAPPGSMIMAARKDRLFLVPNDDRKAIWYSKKKANTVGLEFAAEFVLRMDTEGDIKGLAVMDDKVIVFKEREIYYFYGDGPNSLGQGSFTDIKKITSDCGAVNHGGIVEMPHGLMFKSNKGIYLLSRGMQVSYIASAVQDYNSYSVKAATLIEDKNQVIFLLSGGQPALIYDYLHGLWSTFGNHAGKHACNYDGKYAFITTANRVKLSNSERFTDDTFVPSLTVKTEWITPKTQAWMRIPEFAILGHFKSNHTLTVEIFQDYNDTDVVQTFSFATSTGLSGDEPLSFVGRLSKQKCSAIMFKITDDSKTGSYESYELSGLSLVVGMKEGLVKLPLRRKL